MTRETLLQYTVIQGKFMQSQGFGQSFFRNPTLIAMVVSVGFHGVFALFTLLLPANSRTPENMRLVGIIPTAPQSTIPDTNDPNATLPVPNAPPLGFGDSPFGTTGLERFLQNPSPSDTQPSRRRAQTAFAPSRGGGGGLNIPIKDVPYRAPGRQIPTLKGGSSSSRSLGPLLTPQRRGSSPYDPSQWGRGLPSLQQGEPSGGSGSLLDPGQFGSGNESFGRQPPISQAKKNLSDFYETQRQTGASISGVQSGGTLTAAFPAAACSAALPGGITTIPVAARFGTDGRYVGHLSVLEGSGVPALDNVAIDQVTSQRVTPASIEQIFSFQVQIPYSEAVCPKPAPTTPAPGTPVTPTTPTTQPGTPTSPSTPTAPTPPTPTTEPKASPSPGAPTGPKPDNGLRDDAPLPGAASTPSPSPAPVAPASPASPPPAPAPAVELTPAPAPAAPPPSPAPAAPPAPEPAPPMEPSPSPEIAPPAPDPAPLAPAPAEPAPAPASPPPTSP
jgi:hypothetical protein